ncbi:hypothetical protein AB0I28_13965 [Phytomonospora sp. NPDC050363]
MSRTVTLCPELVGGGPRVFEDGTLSSGTLAESYPTQSGAICLMYERK